MSQSIWLFKTEPDVFGITDLMNAPNQTAAWDGVRNYQARNRLRDEILVGDTVLIYHSSCATPAIVGEARVTRSAHPDPTQFLPEHPAYDDRSTPEAPRWFQVELQFVRQYPSPISLKQIKQNPAFDDMELVIRPRLSIQKVTDQQYQLIEALCQSMGVSA